MTKAELTKANEKLEMDKVNLQEIVAKLRGKLAALKAIMDS